MRENNASPRLRRPFYASQDQPWEAEPYGGIVLAGSSDVKIQIPTSSSVSGLDVTAGFDILLVQQ